MSDVVLYDRMVHAIAACHGVDEVKDLRDKARALEVYAAQAKNIDAERKACEIRLRAERRAGEMFAEMQRTPRQELNAAGANQHFEVTSNDAMQPKSEYTQGLEKAGVSPQTAHRWQQLASVDERDFEDALRSPEKPSTSGVLKAALASPQPKIDRSALWIWGRCRDFERDGFAGKDPNELLGLMTETMQTDMRRIAPMMADFFNAICRG